MTNKRTWTVGIAFVALALLVASVSYAQPAPAAPKPVADTRGDQPAVTAQPGTPAGEGETAEVISQPAVRRGDLVVRGCMDRQACSDHDHGRGHPPAFPHRAARRGDAEERIPVR